jgi:hypothetical protein
MTRSPLENPVSLSPTDNGFSAGSTSQFLPPSHQGTIFKAASTTNPFGDTTIGTSEFGEHTGTGPAGFSFGATAGASGFSFGASAPARTPAQTQHQTVAQRLQELSEKPWTATSHQQT